MPAHSSRWWLLGLLALSLTGTGCVDRLLRIKTEPTGARIFLDGIEVGRAPVEVPFHHYGTREVLVRPDPGPDADPDAPEYASERRLVKLPTPWFQWLGIDVVVEYLWPWTVRDEHEVRFQLAPLDVKALEERLAAESARLDERFDDDDGAGAKANTEPAANSGD